MIYLFDIDGTLLLSGGGGSRALDRVFRDRFGLERAMELIKAGGKTDPIILEEIFTTRLNRAPVGDELAEILALYVPLLRAELAEATAFRIMPAVTETLDYLAALAPAVLLGIATGNVREAARIKLERAGLWHRFGFGGFACDHRDRDRLVERAIDRAHEAAGRQVSRDEIVVVGDTPLDVAAARACGVRVVAVATGSVGRAELAACRPDAVFDTLAELPAWHAAEYG